MNYRIWYSTESFADYIIAQFHHLLQNYQENFVIYNAL